MNPLLLIVLLYDEDGDVFETVEYRFKTYQEIMDYRETLRILIAEDSTVYDFKMTVVKT